MPQVRGDVIKARAARLRKAGEAAVARHLAGLDGTYSEVLTEGPRMGRTESFAEVRFDADQAEGALVAPMPNTSMK
jgi:threonylcarbamoyladenosine tRNA methylthiotransferase MtaB